MTKIISTKTVNGIYYLLFQADKWQSKASYICFGLFSSYELANECAKKYNLYGVDLMVVIQSVKINQFSGVI